MSISLSYYDCTRGEVKEGIYQCSTLIIDNDKTVPEDSIIKVLIGIVQTKRALWDYELPISLRGRNEKDKLWSEVWQEMGGSMTIDRIKKKWKNLRDQFIKTRVQIETFVPSSSGAPHKKKVWKHYESLKFLLDTVQPKQRSTNLNVAKNLAIQTSDESCISELQLPTNSLPRRRRKKRKQGEPFEETLLIHQKPIILPASQQHPLSPSMILASSLLEKLPLRMRLRAERDFINKLYDLVEEYDEDV